MKRFLSVLAAAVLLILSACQPKAEVKYLQTSVTQEYIGTVTFRSETEYDENGAVTAFTQYTDGVEISQVEYSYTDNEIIGKTTQNGETGIIRQKYEKDESGNITGLKMYVDDALYSVTENTYNAEGKILSTTQHTIGIDNPITTAYTYDSNGNATQITYTYGDGIGSVTENTFDEAGNLIYSTSSDLQGNVTRREEHTISEDGVEVIRITEPVSGSVSTRYDTKDEQGNIVLSETYDENDQLMVRVTYTYEKFTVSVK